AVVENGGRGARPVAAEPLAEERRPGVGPALATTGRVVANDGLLVAALLDGDGHAAGDGEARVAAADRLAPQLAGRVRLPVGFQGGADDLAVAPRTEVAGEVVGRGFDQRRRASRGRAGAVTVPFEEVVVRGVPAEREGGHHVAPEVDLAHAEG